MVDFKLKYIIDADGKKAKSELQDVEAHIARLGGGISKATGLSASQLNAVAIGAGAIAAAFGTAVVAGAALSKQLFDLTKEAAEYGDTIFNASEKTGLAAETLSTFDHVAKQSNSSLEQVTNGIAKFSKTVGAASDGSKEAAANLKSLGIDPQEAMQDLEGALDKVFKQVKNAQPGIERTTLLQKAFGKSGADLAEFVLSFNGNLKEQVQRYKELGLTITDDAMRASAEFQDQLDTLNAQFSAVARTIGQEFMPMFMDMAKATSKWAVQNKDEIKTWANTFAVMTRGVLGDLGSLVSYIKDNERWILMAWGLTNPVLAITLGELAKSTGQRYRQQSNALGGRAVIGGGVSPLLDRDYGGGSGTSTTGGRRTGGGTRSGDTRTDKQVYQDFVNQLKRLGVTVGPGQGYRSYGEQAALYNRLPRGQASRPGTSEHEFYKAVDLPPGVSQELLYRAAAAAGVVLGKGFVHQGTGLHRHQAFGKGTGSEGELAEFQDDARKKALESWGKARDLQKQTYDILVDGIDYESEATEKRNKEFLEMVKLEGEAYAHKIESENEILDLVEKQNEERRETLKEMMDASFKGLIDPNMQPKERKTFGGGFFGGIGGTAEADSIFDENGISHIKTQAESLEETLSHLGAMGSDAFGQLAAGFGSMVENWVLFGDAGPDALRKMTASILANLAAQAAVEAIMETARGFAALARYDFVSATNHFTSAAIFGGVAVGAALAGRAVAGDVFTKGQGGAGAGASGGGAGSSSSQSLTPISRTSPDAFISGRQDNPIVAAVRASLDRVNETLSQFKPMRPGDVLVAGANQKQGFIGRQAATDISNNASLGTRIRRVSGSN